MRPWLILLVVVVSAAPSMWAQDDFDREPIRYSQSLPDNLVSRLQDRLVAGDMSLRFEEPWGYLRSVLTALDVSEASQSLVFSKTSLQRHKISPRTPRALYFNDDVYVGYCRNGDVLELSVADAKLGTVYYTLPQEPVESPRFRRQTDNCLVCHAGGQARGVPGHLVRSMYVDKSGHPLLASGSFRIDHSSPLADRFGGWYVSGEHGDQKHLGNLTYRGRPDNDAGHDPSGLNLTDISSRFDRSAYLNGHSDLVALLVLSHQAGGHNLLTKTAFDVRSALYREESLNRELKEPPDHRWDSTNTILKNSAESLVKYFLFVNETVLTAPIKGTTDFAAEFTNRGRRDARGRSLRDFDLQTRMFKYPCSYLTETETFKTLPGELLTQFWKRMDEVLAGSEEKEFAHLSAADRQAIREILAETHRGAPKTWTTPAVTK